MFDAITSDKITAYIASAGKKDWRLPRSIASFRFSGVCFASQSNAANSRKFCRRRRDRVLTADEEREYRSAAQMIGEDIEDAYRRALEGIRAMRGQEPIKPEDPFLLRNLTALLIDCGLSPEEAFRLRWDELRGGAVHVAYGKIVNARRRVPLSARVSALLEMRQSSASSEWVFPSHTASGHAEKSTPKKQHKRACLLAKVQPFTLYTFRHTCLKR